MSQQSQYETEVCPISLSEIYPAAATGPTGLGTTLACGHRFHCTCIHNLYKANKNKFDGVRCEMLVPMCPLCRKEIHSKEYQPTRILSERKLKNLQAFLKEPDYAELPVENRPLRQSQRIVIVDRIERRELLNRLIRERERLLSTQTDVIVEPVANPSGTPSSFLKPHRAQMVQLSHQSRHVSGLCWSRRPSQVTRVREG